MYWQNIYLYMFFTGYYRVNYDEYTWKLIAKALEENMFAIDELNRAQVKSNFVNKYFHLLYVGQ